MRSLATKQALVLARQMTATNFRRAKSMIARAAAMAEEDGCTDARNGVHVPPAVFADEPDLLVRWRIGQQRNAAGFDAAAWRACCQLMAGGDSREDVPTGRSDSTRFCNAVDTALSRVPVRDLDQALAVAAEFGYPMPAAIAPDNSGNTTQGYCSHWIQLGCCPVCSGS